MLLLLTTDMRESIEKAKNGTLPDTIEWQWQIDTMKHFGYTQTPNNGYVPNDDDQHFVYFEASYLASQLFLSRPHAYPEKWEAFDQAIKTTYHPDSRRMMRGYWKNVFLLPKLTGKRHKWRNASNLATATVASEKPLVLCSTTDTTTPNTHRTQP